MRTQAECHRLRLRCVGLWNAGGKTYSEIGDLVGLSRGAVGRMLAEARDRGITVRESGIDQSAQKEGLRAALRRRMGR